MATGVYVIRHPSGIFYIGSARDLIKRRDEHNSRLRNNGHHCARLQEAYNVDDRLEWEYHYIDDRDEAYAFEKELIQQNANNAGLLNLVFNGYRCHSWEMANAASADLRRGVPLTDEHRQKISVGLAKANITPEVRASWHVNKKKPVVINGVYYPGGKDAGIALGVDNVTLLRRCRSNNPKWVDWNMATPEVTPCD